MQRLILGFIDGVVDGVFRHGLHDQLDGGFLQRLLVPGDGIFKFILEAHLLNGQVVAHLLQLLADGDFAAPAADGQPEQPGQRGDHQDRLPPAPALLHPDDGIQRVIKEMRVDLRLEGVELVQALGFLLLHNLIHQRADAPQHAVEGLGYGAHLTEAGLRNALGQVAGLHALNGGGHVADGEHQTIGHQGCHGQGKQQRADQHDGQQAHKGRLQRQQLIQIRHAHQPPAGLVQRGGDEHALAPLRLVAPLADQHPADLLQVFLI